MVSRCVGIVILAGWQWKSSGGVFPYRLEFFSADNDEAETRIFLPTPPSEHLYGYTYQDTALKFLAPIQMPNYIRESREW